MRIGVVSDTHGFFDPVLPGLFANVDHILHGGDIGPASILLQLERIAPVTAVLGNNDIGLVCREFESLTLGSHRIVLHHIVDPLRPGEPLARRLRLHQPHVVVFGHTHRPYAQRHGTTLYLNPGYAGKPRFNLPRSVALLSLEDGDCQAEFVNLPA